MKYIVYVKSVIKTACCAFYCSLLRGLFSNGTLAVSDYTFHSLHHGQYALL